MMAAESMLSKRSVLRFKVALFFLLKLFSSHIYCTTKITMLLHASTIPNSSPEMESSPDGRDRDLKQTETKTRDFKKFARRDRDSVNLIETETRLRDQSI